MQKLNIKINKTTRLSCSQTFEFPGAVKKKVGTNKRLPTFYFANGI